MAEKALRTFIRYLPAAVNDRDPQALQAIIEASSAANLACGNTGLGLVHALTTSPEVPLAHGYQNAAILLAVCKFNREIMDPEHQELIDQLPALYETLKYPTKYAADDIDDGKAALMVKASTGHPFRMNNARSSSGKLVFAYLPTFSLVLAETAVD
jgi:alcohol dehydrogenase class IV